MTDEDKAREAILDAVADFITEAMRHLHRQYGIPPEAVAVGAHAATVVALVEAVGGPTAALCCERAADRARAEPSNAALALAHAVPAGRA